MSRFVDKTATDEIKLKAGDSVQVRQRLTAPEKAALRKRLFRLEADMRTGDIRVADIEFHRQQLELVRSYLAGWSFKANDDDDEPVPYSPERVDDLDDETIIEIADGINRLQSERDSEREKKGKQPSSR